MDNGGGDGIGCFEIKIGADTAKFTNVRIAGCSSKIKPRLRAE